MLSSRKYTNHKIGCIQNEVVVMYQMSPNTIDRSYMNEQMKVHLQFFEQNGISHYQNISKSLHNYGLKAEDERKCIKAFEDLINSQNIYNKILLLKPRELKKANLGERNIILNRLAFEYNYKFYDFLITYLHNNYPDMKNQNDLCQEIKNMIDHLLNQSITRKNDNNQNSAQNNIEYYNNCNVKLESCNNCIVNTENIINDDDLIITFDSDHIGQNIILEDDMGYFTPDESFNLFNDENDPLLNCALFQE